MSNGMVQTVMQFVHNAEGLRNGLCTHVKVHGDRTARNSSNVCDLWSCVSNLQR